MNIKFFFLLLFKDIHEPLNFHFNIIRKISSNSSMNLWSFKFLCILCISLNIIARWGSIVNERLHASQYNLIPYNSKEIRGRINNLTIRYKFIIFHTEHRSVALDLLETKSNRSISNLFFLLAITKNRLRLIKAQWRNRSKLSTTGTSTAAHFSLEKIDSFFLDWFRIERSIAPFSRHDLSPPHLVWSHLASHLFS